MKKLLIIVLSIIGLVSPCRAEFIISETSTISKKGLRLFGESVLGGPNLKYAVGGDYIEGEPIYVLTLEYSLGNDNPNSDQSPVLSVPNGMLLIRTQDGTVIKKQAAYNETLDYTSKNKQKTESYLRKDGSVLSTTTPASENHRYTAYYQFIFTPEEFKKVSGGVLKIRLEAEPSFEMEFKKDKIGDKIWSKFCDIKKKLENKKNSTFEDGF